MLNNSLYGNFRTRTFGEIYPEDTIFINEVSNNPINPLDTKSLTILYYLLAAKYKNWSIANSDEKQFKLKMYSTIFIYGPTWAKRLEIQERLRSLSEDEIKAGAINIYNSAEDPGTAPSTLDKEEVDYVSSQNVNKYKRSTLDAYEYLYDLLKVDVSKSFIDKFKPLFNPFAQPELPLWYEI